MARDAVWPIAPKLFLDRAPQKVGNDRGFIGALICSEKAIVALRSLASQLFNKQDSQGAYLEQLRSPDT